MDRYVGTGQSFQAALDAAVPGDTITLQAGAVFEGSFRLRKKNGTAWITIRSSAMASLPPAGSRVSPAHRIHMPKLVAAKTMPVIKADQGAHHYKIIGLEITSAPGLYNWQMVELGSGSETNADLLPEHIELDRMYIHGDPKVGSKRGITLNSRATTIKNSYISDFKSTWQDTQTISGWNGSGPFTIENNYLEATGENLAMGGSTPAIRNQVPSNITIRRNHLFKPLSWRKGDPSYAGTEWMVKNSFELKNARHVVFEGNVIENMWQHHQRGYAIQLTVRTNNGAVPWAVIEDVTIRNNIFLHCAAGINIMGEDDNGQGVGRSFKINNNIFEDIDSRKWGGSGILFQILKGVDNVEIENNTAFHNEEVISFDTGVSRGFVYRNNISAHNSGIVGRNTAVGNATLQRYAPGAIVTRNVLAGGNSSVYPSGNYFPANLFSVGLADVFGNDYRLTAASPYKLKGTNGKDPGADMTTVKGVTTGVVQ